MKNTLVVVFAATTVALAPVCLIQWQKLAGQKAQVVSLRGEMEQKTREIADLEAAQKLIAKKRHESQEQASDLAVKLQEQRLANTKAAAKTVATLADATCQEPGKGKGGFGDVF